MKKLAIFVLFIYCLLMLHSVSLAGSPADKETVEVKEKFFIQQCEYIYMNAGDFENRIIKIEGLCDIREGNGEKRYYVYRNTPGCCGNDGMIGFRFLYKGDEKLALKDWIAVTASLNIGKDSFGLTTIVLDAMEVTIREERGAEFVRN